MNLSSVYGAAVPGAIVYGGIGFSGISPSVVVTPASRTFAVPANGRTMRAVGTKAAAEVIDFALDWSGLLGSDRVATSSWTISLPGATVTQSYTIGGTLNTVWISGGVTGQFYDFDNTITTIDGRTESAAFRLEIVARNCV